MTKARDLNIDALKGIAVILMVWGHAIQCGLGSEYLQSLDFYNNTIYKLIYGFHMPLFMMLSGYLFCRTLQKRSFSELIFDRLKKLFLPIVSWSGVVYLAKVLFLKTLNINVGTFIRHMLSSLWFLWALLFASLIVAIVNRFLKDNIFVYLAVTLLLSVLPDGYNSELYKYMFPYFVIAYFFAKMQPKIKREGFILVFSLAVYVVLASLYGFDTYVYNSGISLIGKNVFVQSAINLHRFFCGLFGGTAAILAVRMFPEGKIKGFLAKIGVHSLGIYIISGYIVNLLLVRVSRNASYSIMLSIAETAIIVFISFILSLLIRRFKFLNKMLFGGR